VEQKSRKLLAFDLKQDNLKKHYPKPKFTLNPQYYKKAYSDIKSFFKNENWEHNQGSGYISNDDLTTVDITDMLNKMVRAMPWIGACIYKCSIGNIADLEDVVLPIRDLSEKVKLEDIDKGITKPIVSQSKSNDRSTPEH